MPAYRAQVKIRFVHGSRSVGRSGTDPLVGPEHEGITFPPEEPRKPDPFKILSFSDLGYCGLVRLLKETLRIPNV